MTWTCRQHSDACQSYVQGGRNWNEQGIKLQDVINFQLPDEEIIYAARCLQWIGAGHGNMDALHFLEQSNLIEGVYSTKALKDAFEAFTFLMLKDKLAEWDLLEAHRLLMRNQLLEEKYIGHYRDCMVFVSNRVPPIPSKVPNLMKNWLRAIKVPASETECKRTHIAFERIHPMIDGNGRLGRMLLNWQRMKSNLPILTIYERERYRYYEWFG